MKVKIGPVKLEAMYSSQKIEEVKIDDINFIHNQVIVTMKEQGEDAYKSKLRDIALSSFETLEDAKEGKSRLEKDGIFIVPSFLTGNILDNYLSEIKEIVDKYRQKLTDKPFEDQKVLIQKHGMKLNKYSELASYSKSVIDIRGGSDTGMIDIFNIDRILSNKIEEFYKNDAFEELFKSLGDSFTVSNINTYMNSGITSTRGFHADSYTKQIKVFIYLTDVDDFDNGPYTYVRGTHLDTPYKKINQKLSSDLKVKTETPFFNMKDVYPIFAPKGSLVVSNQAGFHRGFPQSEDGFRCILTINCK